MSLPPLVHSHAAHSTSSHATTSSHNTYSPSIAATRFFSNSTSSHSPVLLASYSGFHAGASVISPSHPPLRSGVPPSPSLAALPPAVRTQSIIRSPSLHSVINRASPHASPLLSHGSPSSSSSLPPLQLVPSAFSPSASIVNSSYAESMLKNIQLDDVAPSSDSPHPHSAVPPQQPHPTSQPDVAPNVRESTFMHVWRFIVKLKRRVARMVKVFKQKEADCKAILLARFPCLAAVPASILTMVCKSCQKISRAKHHVLITEGCVSPFIYLLAQGQCMLLQRSVNAVDEDGDAIECQLGCLSSGEQVGLEGLLRPPVHDEQMQQIIAEQIKFNKRNYEKHERRELRKKKKKSKKHKSSPGVNSSQHTDSPPSPEKSTGVSSNATAAAAAAAPHHAHSNASTHSNNTDATHDGDGDIPSPPPSPSSFSNTLITFERAIAHLTPPPGYEQPFSVVVTQTLLAYAIPARIMHELMLCQHGVYQIIDGEIKEKQKLRYERFQHWEKEYEKRKKQKILQQSGVDMHDAYQMVQLEEKREIRLKELRERMHKCKVQTFRDSELLKPLPPMPHVNSQTLVGTRRNFEFHRITLHAKHSLINEASSNSIDEENERNKEMEVELRTTSNGNPHQAPLKINQKSNAPKFKTKADERKAMRKEAEHEKFISDVMEVSKKLQDKIAEEKNRLFLLMSSNSQYPSQHLLKVRAAALQFERQFSVSDFLDNPNAPQSDSDGEFHEHDELSTDQSSQSNTDVDEHDVDNTINQDQNDNDQAETQQHVNHDDPSHDVLSEPTNTSGSSPLGEEVAPVSSRSQSVSPITVARDMSTDQPDDPAASPIDANSDNLPNVATALQAFNSSVSAQIKAHPYQDMKILPREQLKKLFELINTKPEPTNKKKSKKKISDPSTVTSPLDRDVSSSLALKLLEGATSPSGEFDDIPALPSTESLTHSDSPSKPEQQVVYLRLPTPPLYVQEKVMSHEDRVQLNQRKTRARLEQKRRKNWEKFLLFARDDQKLMNLLPDNQRELKRVDQLANIQSALPPPLLPLTIQDIQPAAHQIINQVFLVKKESEQDKTREADKSKLNSGSKPSLSVIVEESTVDLRVHSPSSTMNASTPSAGVASAHDKSPPHPTFSSPHHRNIMGQISSLLQSPVKEEKEHINHYQTIMREKLQLPASPAHLKPILSPASSMSTSRLSPSSVSHARSHSLGHSRSLPSLAASPSSALNNARSPPSSLARVLALTQSTPSTLSAVMPAAPGTTNTSSSIDHHERKLIMTLGDTGESIAAGAVVPSLSSMLAPYQQGSDPMLSRGLSIPHYHVEAIPREVMEKITQQKIKELMAEKEKRERNHDHKQKKSDKPSVNQLDIRVGGERVHLLQSPTRTCSSLRSLPPRGVLSPSSSLPSLRNRSSLSSLQSP